jgi:BMFP domain-containing protein YqiC
MNLTEADVLALVKLNARLMQNVAALEARLQQLEAEKAAAARASE